MSVKVNQLATEWLIVPSPATRATSTFVEIVWLGSDTTSQAILTSLAVETTQLGNSNVRVTQVAVERMLKGNDQAPLRFSQVVFERLMTRNQHLIGSTGLPSSQAFGLPDDGYISTDEIIPYVGNNSAELGIAYLGRILLGSVSSLEPSIEITGSGTGPDPHGFGTGGSLSWGHNKAGGFYIDGKTTVSVVGKRSVTGLLSAPGATTVNIAAKRVRYGRWGTNGVANFDVVLTNTYVAGHFICGGTTALDVVRINFRDGNCQFNAGGSTAVSFRAGVKWVHGTSWSAAGGSAITLHGVAIYGSGGVTFNGNGGLRIVRSQADFATAVGPMAGTSAAVINSRVYWGSGMALGGSTAMQLTGNMQYGHGIGFSCSGGGAITFRAGIKWAHGTSWSAAGGTTVQIRGSSVSYNRFSAAGQTSVAIHTGESQHGSIAMAGTSGLRLGYLKWHAVNYNGTTVIRFTPLLITPEAGYFYWVARKDGHVNADTTIATGFTASGKKGRWENTNGGFLNKKIGLGLPSGPPISKPEGWHRSIYQDWEEFLFVKTATLTTEISNALTFSVSSKTGRGHSSQFGRFTQKNVTDKEIQALLFSQVAVETLGANNPKVRSSQMAVETLGGNTAHLRTTQVAVETLKLANLASVKQIATEALGKGASCPADVKQVAIEVLATSHAAMVVSQITRETMFGEGSEFIGKVRDSQVAVEALRLRTEPSLAKDRVKQVSVEMLSSGLPYVLLQDVGVEAMYNGSPHALVQDIGVEAVYNGMPHALVQDVATEAVHDANPDARIHQIAIELLVKARQDPTVASLISNPRYFT